MKPILFNTEMVRAILDGRKTVTRRIIKHQPPRGYEYSDITSNSIYAKFINQEGKYFLAKKPYINVDPWGEGDNVLYVRETWQSFFPEEVTDRHQQGPRSFSGIPAESVKGHYMYFYYRADGEIEDSLWRPSIHMPKEAARIFLRVKEVRVEKLQDMCVVDCVREGADTGVSWVIDAKPNFIKLWNFTINKLDIDRYGWEANPWVWVIEFERISKEDQ